MWRARAQADRINIGTKDELEVTGYMPNKVKLAFTVILTILTGGLLLILLTWRPSIKLTLTHKRCPLEEAKKLLLKDVYNQLWDADVLEEEDTEAEKKPSRKRKYFINRKLKYVWDETTCTFATVRPLDQGSTFKGFLQKEAGLTGREAKSKKLLFGENFMEIEILSIWELLVQQAFNPFYIFQGYTIILWCLQKYYLFSACILGLSAISITVMVWETRRQSRAVKKRVTTESNVTVIRDGQRNIISSRDVVPEDVILLKDGIGCMEVDAVLLQGSVVTNEAMLTGESIPVTKVAIPIESDTMFNEEEHRYHMLYSGTKILQVRGGKELSALVLKTGFYTTRGELVRSILFPKPADFHFYRDFMSMLSIFIILGLAAMSWSIYHFYFIEENWINILLSSLDLVTFVVPPILPATITAINAGAQQRLKKHGIFCLSSNYISLAGSVDVVCFDKTGTLTETDLALAGVIPCQRGELLAPVEDLTSLSPDLPLTKALATCHSLSNINDKIVGYPLDVKIFGGLDWKLLESEPVNNQDYGMMTPLLVHPNPGEGRDPEKQELAILKTFPFESKEQRMTVITRGKTSNNFEVYIKGAPEMIASLCKEDTVPGDMDLSLEWYTRQGLRVVGVAGLTLPHTLTWEQIEMTSRERLESGAEFLGFVILQNRVKADAPSVISTLHNADISTVMITGDNLLTAVSVAGQSGLLPANHQLLIVKAQMVSTSAIAAQHLKVDYYDVDQIEGPMDKRKLVSTRNDNYVLAADGNTFDLIYRGQDKNLFRRLIHKGKIFARMKPDQKITVVEALRNLGHQVAMCGDGCNDCGALKVANAGISLSSSEASVAAPFSSKSSDVKCVPTLILEGRAALVSLFTAFKYNVSMCFGALICVILQFSINTMPSDMQYLIMDLVLGTIPALVIGITGAGSILVPKRPTKRILSPLPALSMLSFLCLQTLTYWCVLSYIKTLPWFEPVKYTGNIWSPEPSYENTALMLVNFHSFNIGVLVYSHSAPYRKPIYTNYMLTGYLVLAVVFCLFSTFYTGDWLIDLLNFRPFPDSFVSAMIFFAVSVSCLFSLIWERWVLYGFVENYVLPWISKKFGPHAPHIKLDRTLEKERTWPTLSEPPDDDEPVTRNAEPLKAKESLNTYDDDDNNEDSVLIRKLTRRHKFKATVKYVREGPQGPQYSTSPFDSGLATSPTFRPEHHGMDSYNSPRPESAGYQVPWDVQENNGNDFRFNSSIRQQRMRGTGGGFKTFRGSYRKRQGPDNADMAEPYEVIRLTDENAAIYEGSEIYSTMSDPAPSYTDDMETEGNGDYPYEGQYQDPIYEENAATRSQDFSLPETVGEGLPPQSENDYLYDIPRPPRRLESVTDAEEMKIDVPHAPEETRKATPEEITFTASEVNKERNTTKTLISPLSYIDDENPDEQR